MNRVILIGNGFDLAHGLPTGYRDFMNSYWKEFARKPFDEYDFVKLEQINGPKSNYDAWQGAEFLNNPECKIFLSFVKDVVKVNSYSELKQLIENTNKLSELKFKISFNNEFFGQISKASLENWLDIETEYYNKLKSYLKLNNEDRKPAVKKLNKEFHQVKDLLETYLTEVCEKEVEKIDSIKNDIEEKIKYSDIAISKRKLFFNLSDDTISKIGEDYSFDTNFKRGVNGELDEASKQHIITFGLPPLQTLFLNFNYTKTAKIYKAPHDNLRIDIHGQLKDVLNPIIFGYGDEHDEDYKKIENIHDNDFLENIKSIKYHNTVNYRWLFEFMHYDPYQVVIMGHSCGNSDRTLLNTIFEHPNCISIKPFYWDKGNDTNDYNDIIKNISRNFNNKQNMRDIVVNKGYCYPLVPYINK